MTFTARRLRSGKSHPGLSLVVAAATTAACGLTLRAQQQQAPATRPAQVLVAAQPALGINPDAMAGKDGQEGVFVRDSALAVEKFALAQKMERLKEWDKSADLYQEILDKYADRVVPSQVDKDNKIYQYTSVVKGVQEQLAKWPQEGRDVYRARYEATAKQMLDGAKRDDLFTLNQILSKYFVTDSAKTAGLRLIDLNLERGEFLAAARLGDQLIERHPALVSERGSVVYRTALAYHLAKDETRAADAMGRLRRDHPRDLGVVRGKEVVLAESLATELQAQSATPVDASLTAAAAADSYRTFGGDESRARVSTAKGRPGAKLYSVALAKPDWAGVPPQNKAQLDGQFDNALRSGQATGIMPVTDRGELFFQDGRRVYAVSLESGVPLPGWAQTYGGAGAASGRYSSGNAWGSGRTQQLTISLTDTAVLAVLGQPDRLAFSVGIAPQGEARLVCLDRATGAERWSVGPSALAVPKEAEAVKSLAFTGSPLVVGDNVLLTARTNKPGVQFEDCWVTCFDLNDGRYRWSTYLASSSGAGAAFGGGMMATGETATHLAYADGRIYCMTNVGALAALDAYSGTIAWLDIYPRGNAVQDPNQFGGFVGNPFMNQQLQPARRPWAQNPVMAQNGKLFVLPAEAKSLLVYDASSGVEVKRIRLSQFADADTLLGVIGDRLIVCGEQTVHCINWPKYDEATYNDDQLFWKSGENAFPIAGRGFVTTDSVFVTFADRLNRFDMRTGKIADTYPAGGRKWDAAEAPGNVIVTSDHVVIAGPERVDVYTDLTAAKRKLDLEVAAAPKDPQPRLRYAEVMFVSGDPGVATTKLDEAIELLGGIKQLVAGAARDRLFNDALTFARKSAESEGDEGAARALQFFDRAAAAANGPLQQVNYRLARAKFATDRQDPTGAVALYQQILSDPQLRPVPVVDDAATASTGAPTQADAVAERAIGALTVTFPKVYDAFQAQAATAFDQAIATSKPGPMLDVAQVYPNSTVAPRAMLAAADAYEAAKDPRAAINVLRQMYFKFPTAPQKAQILESMARNYLTLPNRVEVAAARLAQGAALPGSPTLTKPLTLPGPAAPLPPGTPFSSALEQIRKVRTASAAARLPDFHIPLPGRAETRQQRIARINDMKALKPAAVASGVGALAEPLRGYERPDRVIAWSKADGLLLFAASPDAPPARLGTSDAFGPDAPPTGVAWLPDDGALVWGASQVAVVSGKGGPAVWKLELKSLPTLEVVKAADLGPAAGGQQGANPGGFNNDVRVLNMRNARFRLQNGGIQQIAPQPQPQKPAANAPEQVVEVLPVGDRVLISTSTGRLLSAEVKDGRVAWQTRLADRPFDRLVATEDFAVVKATDDAACRLIALDSFTGKLIGTRPFSVQVNVPADMPPVNLALSADGTLVYTKADRLVLKDLYKNWTDPGIEVMAAQQQAAPGMVAGASTPYQGAYGSDQLQIAEGRILALADSGANNSPIANVTYVRVHSLETGQPLPLKYKAADGEREVDRVLSAETKGWDVRMRQVGPRLYVWGPKSLMSYNLDRPDESWPGAVDKTDPQLEVNFRDAFVGKDYLILLDLPIPTANALLGGAAAGGGVAAPAAQLGQQQPAEKPTFARLNMFARYPSPTTGQSEVGRIDYVKDLSEPSGFTGDWQAADGGFYYLTGDGNLKLLPGQVK